MLLHAISSLCQAHTGNVCAGKRPIKQRDGNTVRQCSADANPLYHAWVGAGGVYGLGEGVFDGGKNGIKLRRSMAPTRISSYRVWSISSLSHVFECNHSPVLVD